MLGLGRYLIVRTLNPRLINENILGNALVVRLHNPRISPPTIKYQCPNCPY